MNFFYMIFDSGILSYEVSRWPSHLYDLMELDTEASSSDQADRVLYPLSHLHERCRTMIISKILITIELIRAGSALIKEVHQDLKGIDRAVKSANPEKAVGLAESVGVVGKVTRVKCRKALVRKKMREYR